MKTQRGITIASLIIYVVAMSIIVGIMAIVLSFYNKNVVGMNDIGDINLELNKFTTKMIQETQEPENNVTNLTTTTITFKSGNTYIFQDNRIYQNNIEITNNVKEFQAKLETEGDKQLIKIYIVLGKGQAEVVKNLSYVVTATVDGEMLEGIYPGTVKEEWRLASITTATSIQSETTEFIDATEKNTVVVPGGFKVRTDLATTVDKGIVIEDSERNQFVWVPIGEITKSDGSKVNIEFGRYSDFSLTASPAQYASNYASTVTIADYNSEVPTYRESLYASRMPNSNATAKELSTFITTTIDNGGYYIARYEASFGSGDKISSVTNGDSSEGSAGITNQKPRFQVSTTASSSSNMGTVTSTPGMLWNYIRQGDASLACQNLYAGNEYNNQDYVESDLVNSYAWDTAVMFIQKCSDKTYYAYQGDAKGTLHNTGATSDVVCNIYDMSGNLLEWTTEYCSNLNYYFHSCVYRGGLYRHTAFCTAGRKYNAATASYGDNGFRAVLSCTPVI